MVGSQQEIKTLKKKYNIHITFLKNHRNVK